MVDPKDFDEARAELTKEEEATIEALYSERTVKFEAIKTFIARNWARIRLRSRPMPRVAVRSGRTGRRCRSDRRTQDFTKVRSRSCGTGRSTA
jgi:hypothetical protein